jgi:hypothetical protein
MGHTISARKQHQRLLASSVAEWRDWQIAIDCGTPTCTRGRRYLMADLAQVWPDETLSGLLRRMACQVCRGGVTEAQLLRERPMRPRDPPEVIPLRGRGVAM